MIGLYGKIPSHGDFIRRNLPDLFLTPWDHWLQEGLAHAQETLGEAFDEAWDAAGTWRFRLAPGACGEASAEGVLVPSRDWVGRRFPLTVVRLAEPGEAAMPARWYEDLEASVGEALAQGLKADALASALARFDDAMAFDQSDAPAEGWWQDGEERRVATGLPAPDMVLSMLARTR